MYSLIIVEDEEKIRNGLKNLIDWNDLGFEVIGAFEDGATALEFLEKSLVHVVLIDIRMEPMNGLELADHIRQRGMEVKIVFISGYRDFEYARKAIALDAENYLLKPIKLDELYGVFTSLRKKLDECCKEQPSVKREELYESANAYMEEQFLYNLLNGTVYTKEQLEAGLKVLGKQLFEENISVVMMEVMDSSQWMCGFENLRTALRNIVQGIEHLEFNIYPVQMEQERLALIMTGTDADFEKQTLEFAEEIRRNAEEHLKLKILYGVSALHRDALLLPCACVESRRALFGKNSSLKFAEGADLCEDSAFTLKDEVGNLITSIFQGDEQGVERLIYRIFNNVVYSGGDDSSIRNTLTSFITQVLSKLNDSVTGDRIPGFDYSTLFLPGHVLQLRQPMSAYFINITRECIDNRIEQSLVRKAKEYMKAHFSDEISLNMVAEHVFLSPTYFSKVFKKYTGENFIDFLTSIRIDVAKKLMEKNEYKVYEICERVGYKSQKYFSRIFKQYTGLSPSEYQERK